VNVSKMKLQDILKLESSNSHSSSNYIDLEVFINEYENIVDWETWHSLSDEFKSRLKQEDKMHDYCNDGRSRWVIVLSLDGIPFFLYQYIGKGYCENLKVLNKDKLFEFFTECITSKLKDINICESKEDEEITIEIYGADVCYLEDNKLITRYIK
jgi:hypothetical protein